MLMIPCPVTVIKWLHAERTQFTENITHWTFLAPIDHGFICAMLLDRTHTVPHLHTVTSDMFKTWWDRCSTSENIIYNWLGPCQLMGQTWYVGFFNIRRHSSRRLPEHVRVFSNKLIIWRTIKYECIWPLKTPLWDASIIWIYFIKLKAIDPAEDDSKLSAQALDRSEWLVQQHKLYLQLNKATENAIRPPESPLWGQIQSPDHNPS